MLALYLPHVKKHMIVPGCCVHVRGRSHLQGVHKQYLLYVDIVNMQSIPVVSTLPPWLPFVYSTHSYMEKEMKITKQYFMN